MKFAKELEREAIPEWRAKYLNYRQGKKYIGDVVRSLSSLGTNPSPISRFRAPMRRASIVGAHNEEERIGPSAPVAIPNRQAVEEAVEDGSSTLDPEMLPLSSTHAQRGMKRYGSIIASPPIDNTYPANDSDQTPRIETHKENMPRAESLVLPDPAIHPDDTSSDSRTLQEINSSTVPLPPSTSRNAYEVGKTRTPLSIDPHIPHRLQGLWRPKRTLSSPHTAAPTLSRDRSQPLFKRMLSGTDRPRQLSDVDLHNYKEVQSREKHFFCFLDMELEKISSFYEQKEKEASGRLKLFREQLHMMLGRKQMEMEAAQARRTNLEALGGDGSADKTPGRGQTLRERILKPFQKEHDRGANSGRTLESLATPIVEGFSGVAADYERPVKSYRRYKKTLRPALEEFYRTLLSLRSYASLNQKAFKKICKKYDKRTGSHIQREYLARVHMKDFVSSDTIEQLISDVEDLYARYFERGNRKAAIGKLQLKAQRRRDYSGSAAPSAFIGGAGLALGIIGLVEAAHRITPDMDIISLKTSYLLQIYGGYLLIVLLTLLFCVACGVWQNNNVNYPFIFEHNLRHHLHWKELFEFPCLCLGFLGLTVFLNFYYMIPLDALYTWWPAFLVIVTCIVIAFPLPVLRHNTRLWFLNSVGRVFCAGIPIFPITFRDFFLGDMLCSLTYVMGNIPLFFCLYDGKWSTPARCNSSHSVAIGILSTVPGLIRAVQCLRNVWKLSYKGKVPLSKNYQLRNFGKYMATTTYYATLYLYRLNKTRQNRMIFIVFATFNSVYCTIWDILIDWSLLLYWHHDHPKRNGFHSGFGLRDVIAFKRQWWYYIAIALDPVLRFNWIFYIVGPGSTLQHSALAAFLIALSEVIRRGLWSVFRVENEHCNNIKLRKAHDEDLLNGIIKKLPLPRVDLDGSPDATRPPSVPDLEEQRTNGSTSKKSLRKAASSLQMAHRQDFERTRPPEDDVEAEDSDDSDDEVDSPDR